jgi:hypothetical protein
MSIAGTLTQSQDGRSQRRSVLRLLPKCGSGLNGHRVTGVRPLGP